MTFTNKLQPILYKNFPDFDFKPEQGSGRTTAFAMKAVSYALLNPEIKIDLHEIKQLDCAASMGVVKAAGGFIDAVSEVIDKLGLRFMVVDRTNATLTYKLFNE